MICEAVFAGRIFRYRIRYPETISYFRGYMRESEGIKYKISVSDKRFKCFRSKMSEEASDPYVEFSALTGLTSLRLLKYHSCIFHGIAFMYNGKAWILTAPSGTGKTTQFRNWTEMHPGEIKIINGYKPLLECQDSGDVIVHPTPWMGKENYGNGISAPLKGIVYLKQGLDNKISVMRTAESVFPVMKQFIVRPVLRGDAVYLSETAERLLRNVPVWGFVNDGTKGSTEMLRELMKSCGETEK